MLLTRQAHQQLCVKRNEHRPCEIPAPFMGPTSEWYVAIGDWQATDFFEQE